MDTIIHRMYAFQKKRGVKDQCMTNSQYIYDCLRHSGVDSARVTPTLVVHLDEENKTLRTIAHLVVLIDDAIVDASYDVASLKNKNYYFTVAECLEAIKDIPITSDFVKGMIETFLPFIDFAKRINAGEILIADGKHYNQQADFIEAQMN